MTYLDAHQQANAALPESSSDVFGHLPTELDEMFSDVSGVLIDQQPMTRPMKVALMTVLRHKQEVHSVQPLRGLGWDTQGWPILHPWCQMDTSVSVPLDKCKISGNLPLRHFPASL